MRSLTLNDLERLLKPKSNGVVSHSVLSIQETYTTRCLVIIYSVTIGKLVNLHHIIWHRFSAFLFVLSFSSKSSPKFF